MTTYIPAFEPQHDEGLKPPFTNCNPASAAMLIAQWTYGKTDTSDVPIRKASGIAPDQGMNFAAVALGIRRLFPTLGDLRYSEAFGASPARMIFSQLLEHLANGGGAVVCGNYGDLPVRLRRWSPAFTGGHATFVCDYRPASGDVLWMDPLGGVDGSDYAGERISRDALWGFIWTAGSTDAARNYVTAAHSFSVARPPAPSEGTFSDVPVGVRYHRSIERMAAAGVMPGYRDGTFRPNRTVTRGELAATLDRFARRAGLDLSEDSPP